MLPLELPMSNKHHNPNNCSHPSAVITETYTNPPTTKPKPTHTRNIETTTNITISEQEADKLTPNKSKKQCAGRKDVLFPALPHLCSPHSDNYNPPPPQNKKPHNKYSPTTTPDRTSTFPCASNHTRGDYLA